MKRLSLFMTLVAILGFATFSNATLINNGGGLVYDTDLDITWYIAAPVSEGTINNGSWYTVTSWVDTLTLGATEVGSWRLPTTPALEGEAYTNEGEMGHLYYDELLNSANELGGPLANKGPFEYLIAGGYWTGTEVAGNTNYAWRFDFSKGKQYAPYTKDTVDGLAIAVHSGNIKPISAPEPANILLLGLGLVGLTRVRRKLKK